MYSWPAPVLTNFAVEYDCHSIYLLSRYALGGPDVKTEVINAGIMQHKLEADPERKKFAYVIFSHRHGQVRIRLNHMPLQIDRLEDEQAYERLQQFVKSNAARIARENARAIQFKIVRNDYWEGYIGGGILENTQKTL